MHTRSLYASQPYKVGSKKANSWAYIIPAPIVKRYNIDESSILLLRGSEKQDMMTLQFITDSNSNINMIKSTNGESLVTPYHQVSETQ